MMFSINSMKIYINFMIQNEIKKYQKIKKNGVMNSSKVYNMIKINSQKLINTYYLFSNRL